MVDLLKWMQKHCVASPGIRFGPQWRGFCSAACRSACSKLRILESSPSTVAGPGQNEKVDYQTSRYQKTTNECKENNLIALFSIESRSCVTDKGMLVFRSPSELRLSGFHLTSFRFICVCLSHFASLRLGPLAQTAVSLHARPK